MKKDLKIILVVIFLLVFIFIILFFNNKINQLTKKHNNLEIEHTKLLEKHNSLVTQNNNLEKTHVSLISEFNDLNLAFYNLRTEHYTQTQNYNNLLGNYDDLNKDYSSLNTEIGVFKKSIEESMDWFKENATLDLLKENRSIKNNLKKCVVCQEEVCYIKTACIYLVNKEKFYLKYQIDILNSDKEDKLLSLNDFYSNKRGDCEDFSLFFVSELRYLIEYVELKDKIPIIEAIIETDSKRNYDIVDNWYFPGGISQKIISEEYIYPYVACGEIYDPNIDDIGGHCLVMLSKQKINNGTDLKNITDIELIEPQNGLYVEKATNYDFFKTDSGYKIRQIITDNDYYMHDSILFNNDNKTWYSYGYYYNKILEKE